MEKVDKRDKEIIERMNHAKEQMKALENRIARDKVNTRYRVTVSDTLSNNKAASLIADAILFDPQAVQLVARFSGDNLEMEKDWEMMNEFDKDEIIHKKILRSRAKSVAISQKVIDTKSWQFAITTASYEIFLEMIPLDSSKAVQIKFKEVLTMRNKFS